MAKQIVWMVAQAAAVIGLTWIWHAAKPDSPLGAILLINIVVVAFTTAVAVNLSDWLRRVFRRHAPLGEERELKGERLSPPRVGGGLRELTQDRDKLRIG